MTTENQDAFEVVKELLRDPDSYHLVVFIASASETESLIHVLSKIGGIVTHSNFYNVGEELVAQILSGTRPLRLEKFETPEVLILEDLPYLAYRYATQQEVFALLKNRIEAKKLTIIFSPIPLSRLRNGFSEEFYQLLTQSSP